MTVIRGTSGLIDTAAIAAWTLANAQAREEYRLHPVAGRFDDNRQTPCATCQEPTYSQRGLCAACRKGER